jgi:multidrug resistance efflux pump
MVNKGDPLVRLDPNQLESSTEAQLAAFQSAQNEVNVSQSQVTAAQNALAQAQQQLNISQVAVDSARQSVTPQRSTWNASKRTSLLRNAN